MKKILLFAVLSVIGIYGVGYRNLGAAGVHRFLDTLETATLRGDTSSLCDSLADDMQFKIKDHTAKLVPGGQVDQEGTRNEMCAQMTASTSAMANAKIDTQLERSDFVVERDLLHPWTARVSFTEYRSVTIPAAKVTIKTESDDRYVLVQTFSGVKIKSLESEAFLQQD